MLVKDFLQRDQNNLDAVRLILAAMVIYGHSFAVTPHAGMGVDALYQLTGLNSASVAIKGFFMISGLLVGFSLIRSDSVKQYALARFFRIWPALIVVTMLLALVAGPAFTSLASDDYFASDGLWTYIIKTIGLQNWGGQTLGYYDLPGVFESNPFPKNVNAPLWSIAAEVFCYIVLACVYAVGGLKKWTATALFALIVIDSLLPTKLLFYWLPQNNPDFSLLPYCFALGVILAVWREKIWLGTRSVVGMLFLAYFFRESIAGDMLAYTAAFLIMIWLSIALRKVRLPVDASYGLYLVGWPVQQAYASLFPSSEHWVSFTVSLGVALVFAVLSAYLIEQPSIRLGRFLSRRYLKA